MLRAHMSNATSEAPAEPASERSRLGPGEVALFMVVSVFSARWMGAAAAAGPSAVVLWLVAAGALFLPLALSIATLSAAYPDDGGLAGWAHRAFGPWAGFVA